MVLDLFGVVISLLCLEFTTKKSFLAIWLYLPGVNDIFYELYFLLVQLPSLKPIIPCLLRCSFILIINIPDFLPLISYLYLYMHMKLLQCMVAIKNAF